MDFTDTMGRLAMNIVHVGYHSTNYYVIGNSHVQLLVDAGWPGTLPEFLAVLKRKNISLQQIRYQMVTHYHPDHAGLAQDLKRLGFRLIVLEHQISAISLLKTITKPVDRYTPITLHDNLLMTTEASRSFLSSIGIAGEIISTPGHSADSVTLILDQGAAFTGDLQNPGFVAESAMELTVQSWTAIRALGVTTVYPGHGPVTMLSAHASVA